MRFLYAKFINYIGFYNGMQLHELEIDFTRCKNSIILIQGSNAVGKSTILGALTPFPDPSSSYIPNQTAEKILRLGDNSDIYDIHITSPADMSGRKTTKAYIRKNGIELNENGNVSSYKDIIFSEFDLDSNYISLTQLSSTDRGLGDKRPAERKKFVSNIIDNLEVYNDLYKALNKKSLIFKSHVNTLHTKINNIGDKNSLEVNLSSLQSKYNEIANKIDNLKTNIIQIDATENSKDSVELVNKLRELENDLNIKSNEKADLLNKVNIHFRNTKINKEDINNKYEKDMDSKTEYEYLFNNKQNDLNISTEKLSLLYNQREEQKSNLEIYSSNDIDSSIKDKYESICNEVSNIERTLNNYDIIINTVPGLNINYNKTSLDLIQYLNQLLEVNNRIESMTESFVDSISLNDIENIVYGNYKSSKELRDELNLTIEESQNIRLSINDINQKISTLSILDKRPKECKIDTCVFISDALDIQKEKNIDQYTEELEDLMNKLDLYSKNITILQKSIDDSILYESKSIIFNNIINEICNNKSVLLMFGFNEYYNIDILKKNLSNGIFTRDNMDLYINYLNDLKIYQNNLNIKSNLNSEYIKYQNSQDSISLISASIDKLNVQIESEEEKYNQLKHEKDEIALTLNQLNILINQEENYINDLNKYNEVYAEYDDINSEISILKEKNDKILNSAVLRMDYENQINQLTPQLNQLSSEINKLSGQLLLLDDYYNEYNSYKLKYDRMETLKKYCSPTGGGIQTIFMQLYLGKTMDLANQVLNMLFGGEYKLLDFIINKDEFRIPFIGSGLTVDDISSGSNSQIAIMGLAINLALFYQASSKYNIARLDEVDDGLDHRNRYEFINVLHKCQELLNIEQLFVISHSLEADNSTVDIIKLKTYSDFEDTIMGNVIYDYNNEPHK